MAGIGTIINPLGGINKRNTVISEDRIPRGKVTPSDIFIIRLNNEDQEFEKLKIQCVPLEVVVQPESNWAVIPSVGRNNPFYNYTGGEDTLTFTLDWYSNEELKEDVIRNCRWLESLSRADAYFNEPPQIILKWGNLFRFQKWIVQSAGYRLSIFSKEDNMMPIQAYQDITLKKVVGYNTSIEEIRGNNGPI